MRDTIRLVPMRGFTAAVAKEDSPTPQSQAAGVTVGVDGEGADRRLILATRHADGTMLTVSLSDSALDRLAHLIADLVGEAALSPIGAAVTIQ